MLQTGSRFAVIPHMRGYEPSRDRVSLHDAHRKSARQRAIRVGRVTPTANQLVGARTWPDGEKLRQLSVATMRSFVEGKGSACQVCRHPDASSTGAESVAFSELGVAR